MIKVGVTVSDETRTREQLSMIIYITWCAVTTSVRTEYILYVHTEHISYIRIE